MNILLIVLTSFSALARVDKEILAAREAVKAMIAPLLRGDGKERPKGTEKFRVDACEKHQINWKEFLTLQQSLTLSFKFKEGCDIQGNIAPRPFGPFPADLDLRNLMDFTHLNSSNQLSSTLELKPVMTLEMREGKLTGKRGKVRFEADYQLQINPMNRAQPIEKNIGGELRITEIYGLKVSIKEKINVK